MDILRKELNTIYAAQNLDDEYLDNSLLERCQAQLQTIVAVDRDCRVLTDAAADTCYIYGGAFAGLIGLCECGDLYNCRLCSSDEDVIYNRIHPEDLVDKRMLEYEFFKFIDPLPGDIKLQYQATCRFRIRNRHDEYIYVKNSTKVMRTSPAGKIWLILCSYDLSPSIISSTGIAPRIINSTTGEIVEVQLSDRRGHILTGREKEILTLIKEGHLSKEIAAMLNISLHTVNRHRQNILEKLSVGNSMEAVMAATAMKLL